MSRADLATIASAEAGIREGTVTGDIRISEYQSATWLAVGAWPWCAAFVAWAMQRWIADPNNLRLCISPGFPSERAWRFRSAKAYDLEQWGEDRRLRVLNEHAAMEAGDIVTFDASHCGIVLADNGATIQTVEGNTSSGKRGSQRDGDGVYIRNRTRSWIRSVIRLPGD